MHHRLVSWARAVKARRRGAALPVVWLFTDPVRVPDVLRAVVRLPPGCGVVFRHDGVPGRAALARQVAQLCRARRLVMVMTPPRIAGVGLHIRRGRRPDARAMPRLVSSSAHNRPELLRARRAGASVLFLSPLFATASHAGGVGLGGLRWVRAGLGLAKSVWALGGVGPGTIRAVPQCCRGFGAIGGLADCG